ncbi:MAG: hypothetical protein J0L82_19240 [Deltaproteobacteria bacterium]|nr:hypothetical protein [Deltaproteobacteria bacterium]
MRTHSPTLSDFTTFGWTMTSSVSRTDSTPVGTGIKYLVSYWAVFFYTVRVPAIPEINSAD